MNQTNREQNMHRLAFKFEPTELPISQQFDLQVIRPEFKMSTSVCA